MMLREIYGIVLGNYRRDQFLTMRQLSKKTGVSISMIHNIEHGTKEASSEILEDICGGLGLNTLDLLEMSAQELALARERQRSEAGWVSTETDWLGVDVKDVEVQLA